MTIRCTGSGLATFHEWKISRRRLVIAAGPIGSYDHCSNTPVGIIALLLPWGIDWNASVIPWNFCVATIGYEQPRAIFALRRAGVRMLQAAPGQPIYAVAFIPETFSPKLMLALDGLPNLTQIQLAGTAVRDQDLKHLLGLRKLQGLGLDDTGITDAGLHALRDLPSLRYIEREGTSITDR